MDRKNSRCYKPPSKPHHGKLPVVVVGHVVVAVVPQLAVEEALGTVVTGAVARNHQIRLLPVPTSLSTEYH